MLSALTALTATVATLGDFTALSSAITALVATVDGKADASALTTLMAQVTTLGNTITAVSTSVTELTASLAATNEAAGLEVSAREALEVRVEDNEDGLTALARWTVKLTVGDLTGSIGLVNDGGTVRLVIAANRFAIVRPGVTTLTTDDVIFGVETADPNDPTDTDKVVMKSAFIARASIDVAHIVDGFLTNLTADKGTIRHALIERGDIFDLTVGNVIQSDNYQSLSDGFRITRDGAAEFNDFVLTPSIISNVRNAQVLVTVTLDGLLISNTWRAVAIPTDISTFDALLVLGLGDDRSGFGTASREVLIDLIPGPNEDIDASSIAWRTIGGSLALLVNVLGSRNAADDVNLFIRKNDTGTILYFYEENSNFRLKGLLGLIGPASDNELVGSLAPGSPGVPTDLAVSGTLSNQQYSWLRPAFIGSGLTLYRWSLTRYASGGMDGITEAEFATGTTGTTTSFLRTTALPSLGSFNEYRLYVRAEGSGGNSEYARLSFRQADFGSLPDPDIDTDVVSLSITEGSSGTIRVRLTSQPASNVTVQASENDPDITVSPSSRAFTTSNWNSYQNFTVSAPQDSDTSQDTALVTFQASGGSTDSVTISVSYYGRGCPDPGNSEGCGGCI